MKQKRTVRKIASLTNDLHHSMQGDIHTVQLVWT